MHCHTPTARTMRLMAVPLLLCGAALAQPAEPGPATSTSTATTTTPAPTAWPSYMADLDRYLAQVLPPAHATPPAPPAQSTSLSR